MQQSEPPFGVLDRVQHAVEVCSVPSGDRGVQEWMDLIGEVSAAMTVLAAARDAAIVRLAAIDEVVTEDGVMGEQVNGLGTVSLDAAAMVSTATGTSTRFGEEMVSQAVTRVVRVPALHQAMVSGALDDYKARCVGAELAEVPPELARAVVDAVAPVMGEKSGPALRRRTRDILFALAPELLRKRIRTARNNVGLRRWLGEPGTDAWSATFPSERAAATWAAIDALAREYRSAGKYPTLEQARAYALLDLVDARTTVKTVLHLTVPVDALDADGSAVDDAADGVAGAAVDDAGGDAGDASRDDAGGAAAADDAVGAAAEDAAGAAAEDPAGAAGDDGVTPSASGEPAGSTGETFVAAAAHGGGVAWMPQRAVRGAVQAEARPCHPRTGALLDLADSLATQAYRPGKALTLLVRLRDGRCRFPGCATAARQCDLDHVIPWPNGPTSAVNLICLCRRHHRVKQRHRWRVRLRADGCVEWTDPAGRRTITEPVDHLRVGQPRVTHVMAATPEDIAELVEWERVVAQFDPHSGVELTDLADLDLHGVTPGSAAGSSGASASAEGGTDNSEAGAPVSGAEVSLSQLAAAVVADVLRPPAEAAIDDTSGGRDTTPDPWRRKRFGNHTSVLDRIPRPERPAHATTGPPAPGALGALRDRRRQEWARRDRPHDGPTARLILDCRFDAGTQAGLVGVSYRAGRRHRRRAAALAAGEPPF